MIRRPRFVLSNRSRLCCALLGLCLTSGIIIQCHGVDAGDAWKSVIAKCAKSDRVGSNTLFFGLTNDIGAGSVWKKTAVGSYALYWSLADVIPDSSVRASVYDSGATATCTGKSAVSWSGNIGLALNSKISPLAPGFSAAIGSAKKVTVSIDGYRWESVKSGPLLRFITSLPSDDRGRMDFMAPTNEVAIDALRVTGLTADLTFDSKDFFALKTKWDSSATTKDTTGGISADWSHDDTLHLTSRSGIYIAVNLDHYSLSGPAGEHGSLERSTVPKNTIVTDHRP